MAKYLKHFSQHSDYEDNIRTAFYPNVSICDDDEAGTIHYNLHSNIPSNEI